MSASRPLVDRQVGRNAQLLAEEAGALPTAEARYPYVRILAALIDGAHPEWARDPAREGRVAALVAELSDGALDADEVAEVVRVRDEERGVA